MMFSGMLGDVVVGAARREQGPGHGSVRPTAQRAPSRPGAAVPKDQDVRTPSRRQAARICHSTERSIVGITTSGGSSRLPASPTRACFRARARAHVRVQRSFGPTHLCAGARGGHHHSATQCQHMTHASCSAAPPTPRPARRGARASTRATHESARRMDRARPRTRARPTGEGGPPGSARPTARAPIAPRSHEKSSKNFPPPSQPSPLPTQRPRRETSELCARACCMHLWRARMLSQLRRGRRGRR